jgi:NADP-dependent 3-hydroxy acid dehydrogenase YdfG
LPALIDQVAVVTGASSGIGQAIALSLAGEGAKVCLVGRELEKLEAVASRARLFTQHIAIYKTDLWIDDDIHLLAASLQRDFEAIDILIHSAGVISLGRIDKVSMEDFDWQYRINVRAPFKLTQLLLPMLRSRNGQVVFINSSAGLSAKAGLSQYSATKHGLKAVADSLRAEVNENGLRVLSVYPGRTATAMQAQVFKAEGGVYRPEMLLQPEDVSQVVVDALKLPKTAEVTDIMVRPAHKF